MSHCGAVVKEMLERVDKPGSTPGDAVFCFFVPFFLSIWSLFLTLFFLLAFFPLFLLLTLLVMHLDLIIYFRLNSGVNLICILAYDQKKTVSCQDISFL